MAGILLAAQEILVNLFSEHVTVYKAIAPMALAALASAGSSLIGSGLNFLQAGKQKRKANEAADKASTAFDTAINLIEPNYLENVTAPLEAFEQERLSGLMGTQQIVQAGQEGEERGAIAVAGRANAINQQAQARSRQNLANMQFGLNKAIAAEDARIAGVKSGLRQQEARGYQSMAADARQAQQQQMASGAQGLVSAGAAGLKALPLFGGNNAVDPAAISNTAEEMSFQDVFGSVTAAPIVDANSVQVMEEDLDPIIIS
jgi:hypothetical protein